MAEKAKLLEVLTEGNSELYDRAMSSLRNYQN